MTAKFDILAASDSDLESIARIHREARLAAMPWLPDIHTPEEDLWFFQNIVFKQETLLVARESGRVLGFVAYKNDWLNHLYVAPAHWCKGVGAALLGAVRAESPALQLWTFQKNLAARRFYEAHGFVECERTDGQDNEEKKPDMRMVWRP